jgi:hypothetical protein
MLLNHFRLAIRNIYKHKAFSMINIIGLTIGLAGILFVGSYIYGELNVNQRSGITAGYSKSKVRPDLVWYDFFNICAIVPGIG